VEKDLKRRALRSAPFAFFDTFDGANPRFINRDKNRRSVSTLSIPGLWFDKLTILNEVEGQTGESNGFISSSHRRERWKNGNARFAVIFTIPSRAILTAISLRAHPLINFPIPGSARCAALPKICLKRNKVRFVFQPISYKIFCIASTLWVLLHSFQTRIPCRFNSAFPLHRYVRRRQADD